MKIKTNTPLNTIWCSVCKRYVGESHTHTIGGYHYG